MDTATKLQRLADLKAKGIITIDEFEAQKKIVLAQPITPPPSSKKTLVGCGIIVLLLLALIVFGVINAFNTLTNEMNTAPQTDNTVVNYIKKCAKQANSSVWTPCTTLIGDPQPPQLHTALVNNENGFQNIIITYTQSNLDDILFDAMKSMTFSLDPATAQFKMNAMAFTFKNNPIQEGE